MLSDIVIRKLASLERCLERIANRLPETAETFAIDLDRQDIVILNLERAIQISIDLGIVVLRFNSIPIPETYGEIFLELQRALGLGNELATSLKQAASFRNLAVYEYSKLDLERVFLFSKRELEDLRSFGSWVKNLTSL